MRYSSLLLTSIVVAGCGQSVGAFNSVDTEAIGNQFDPIVGGTVDTSNSDNDAVVWLYAQDYGAMCTGTAIAPNVIVTARHCVSQTAESVKCYNDVTGEDFSASEIVVAKGVSPIQYGPYGASFDKHSLLTTGKQIFHDGSKSLCGHDLAVIVTSDNMVPTVTPKRVRVAAAPTVGETFRAVGYGLTSQNNEDSYGTRYYRDGVRVTRIYSGQQQGDFQGTQSICSGDSGGPALSSQGAVFGVTSRGGMYCNGNDNVWTRTDVFKSIIDEAMTAAGATYTGEDGTVYEPAEGGSGAAGAGGSGGGGGSGAGGVGGAGDLGGFGGNDEPVGTGGSSADLEAKCDPSNTACPDGSQCVQHQDRYYCAPKCADEEPMCPANYECAVSAKVCTKSPSCSEDNTCAPDMLCVRDDRGKYCALLCDEHACPGGYTCEAVSGMKLCARNADDGGGSHSWSCSVSQSSSPATSSWVLLGIAASVAATAAVRRRRQRRQRRQRGQCRQCW